MEVTIPCSDDLRHPKGTSYKIRLMPALFQGPSYPRTSPHRCFNCHLRFGSVPLMYPRSIAYHRTNHRTTAGDAVVEEGRDRVLVVVEWSGNFCSVACRARFMDDCRDPQVETHRMHMVMADRLLFPGLDMDYSLAAPTQVERKSGYLAQPVSAHQVHDEGMKHTFETRGVRETFYGELEGGLGEAGIDHLLIHGKGRRDEDATREEWDRRVGVLPPWISAGRLEEGPLVCWWCSKQGFARHYPIPTHRDMLNTIHVKGTFCHPACGVAYLLHQGSCVQSSVGVTHHHERVGLFVYIMVNVYGVEFGTRFSVAPHFLELEEFGGDLSREEFDIQCDIPDLLTSWELSPFVSAKMPMNYTRPGVVCDIMSTHRGESSFEPQKITATEAPATTETLFDILLREQLRAAAHSAQTTATAAATTAAPGPAPVASRSSHSLQSSRSPLPVARA